MSSSSEEISSNAEALTVCVDRDGDEECLELRYSVSLTRIWSSVEDPAREGGTFVLGAVVDDGIEGEGDGALETLLNIRDLGSVPNDS